MSFVALFLLLLGITFLYAAWKDVSPLLVVRSFIEHKALDEYTEQR